VQNCKILWIQWITSMFHVEQFGAEKIIKMFHVEQLRNFPLGELCRTHNSSVAS